MKPLPPMIDLIMTIVVGIAMLGLMTANLIISEWQSAIAWSMAFGHFTCSQLRRYIIADLMTLTRQGREK